MKTRNIIIAMVLMVALLLCGCSQGTVYCSGMGRISLILFAGFPFSCDSFEVLFFICCFFPAWYLLFNWKTYDCFC